MFGYSYVSRYGLCLNKPCNSLWFWGGLVLAVDSRFVVFCFGLDLLGGIIIGCYCELLACLVRIWWLNCVVDLLWCGHWLYVLWFD